MLPVSHMLVTMPLVKLTQQSWPVPQLVGVQVRPPSPIMPPLLLPLLLPEPLLLPLPPLLLPLLEELASVPLLLPLLPPLPLPLSPSLPLPVLLVLPPHAAATADTAAPTIKSIFILRIESLPR